MSLTINLTQVLRRTSLLTLVIAFGMLLVLGTGGGSDDGHEHLAWVRIDAPIDGYATSSESVTVEGNAAMFDGSPIQGSVIWINGSFSGVLPKSTICILACASAFRGDVPLLVGNNTITVQVVDGSDSVTVIRYPRVVASGRVALASGQAVWGVTIRLSGTLNLTTRTDNSNVYVFENLPAGDYRVSASLVPPQFVGCLGFAPDSHDFSVVTDEDIRNLDFTATQLASCYRVSGRIVASTDPNAGIANMKLVLKDSNDVEYVVYSNTSGYYDFWHLGPGSYTITPEHCGSWGCTSFIPSTMDVTITDSDRWSVDFVWVNEIN